MYKKMYLKLFNAVTDALEAMERRNYGQAEDLLKRGQQEAGGAVSGGGRGGERW